MHPIENNAVDEVRLRGRGQSLEVRPQVALDQTTREGGWACQGQSARGSIKNSTLVSSAF
jgi:hypothetical protein